MWNNRWLLLGVMTLSFWACKKQNISGEFTADDFPTDSATAVYRMRTISGTTESRIMEVEFVKFGGVNPEMDFSTLFLDSTQYFGLSVEINAESVLPPDPIPSYTNVLMVETNGTDWMEFYKMTMGFSRFFEDIEGTDLKKTGVVTFRSGDGASLNYGEVSGSIFQRTAAENKEVLYRQFAPNQYDTFGTDSDATFANQLNEVMDSLILSTEVVGQKMITIFDQRENGGQTFFDITLFDPLIEKAQLNNIQINIVTEQLFEIFDRLAQRTGGFLLTRREGYALIAEDLKVMESLGVLMLNMDRLASRNLWRHFFSIEVRKELDLFDPEEVVRTPEMYYDNQRFIYHSFPAE